MTRLLYFSRTQEKRREERGVFVLDLREAEVYIVIVEKI